MGTRLRLPALTRKQRLAALTACAIAALAAIAVLKSGHAHAAAPQADAGPAMVKKDGRIVVPANSPLRSRVVVAPVSNLAAPHTISLPGVVEADPARTVNILPPLTGRLTELKVGLGDTVRAGQLLAVISSPDLDQAWSDAEKAHDALDLAKKALDRAHEVHDAGANAVKDYEQAQSIYAQAQSEDKRAQARLATLGMGSAKSRTLALTAPVAGTVTALNNGLGSYLNDPTATLMTIANLDNVWVTANVPEDLIGAISRGQTAEVALPAFPGKKWQGKVSFVSAVLESDTHRNKTRISFANPDGRLKPNMYATVDVAVPQSASVTVPTSALLMNNDSVTVFVETAPWTFERRSVELGHEDGETVRIVSGLAGGERVVVRGGVLLND